MSTPFFIVGIGRSGTTLLRLMFHSHPAIAIPYESHFITDYYQSLSEYGDLSDDKNLLRLLDDIFDEELIKAWDHDFSSATIMAQLKERNLGAVFREIYDDYARAKGKSIWGDKSDYLDRMHIINELFPDAKFIHIIRDGRDVANSVLKLPWGPRDIIQAAEWWHQHVILGRRMGMMLGKGRYTEVTYEDLVSNSEGELKRLCQFVGVEFSPDMLEYYKTSEQSIPESRKSQHYNANSPPRKDRIAAWKKEMNPTDIALFNHYAQHSLAECGYEVPDMKINKYYLLLAKLLILVKRQFN